MIPGGVLEPPGPPSYRLPRRGLQEVLHGCGPPHQLRLHPAQAHQQLCRISGGNYSEKGCVGERPGGIIMMWWPQAYCCLNLSAGDAAVLKYYKFLLTLSLPPPPQQ